MKSKPPIETLLNRVEWAPVTLVNEPNHEGPYATHSGELVLGDFRLKCWRLNTGDAVIDADAIEQMFPGWQEMMSAAGQVVPPTIAFRQP